MESKIASIPRLHEVKVGELVSVSRHGPGSLLQHLVNLGLDLRSGLVQVSHGELVEWSSRLNVVQSLLQSLELSNNALLGGLSVLHSLGLKSLNGLNLLGNVVSHGLECLVGLLNLVHNRLVLKGRTVVSKVDLLVGLVQVQNLLLGLIVSLSECQQRGTGVTSQSQGRNDLRPVELNSRFLMLASRLLFGYRLLTTLTVTDMLVKNNY